MKSRRFEIFLEFLIFGIIMGVTEDIIAVSLTTGEPITLRTILVISLVAIPFAAVGELIVDRGNLIPVEKKKK